MARLRSVYGAGPLHLIALVASLAITAAAVVRWFDSGSDVVNILVWFTAAAVGHDLVLLPMYSVLDRIATGSRGRARPSDRASEPPVAPGGGVAYVRIPALLSGLLGLTFLPLILKLGDSTFYAASTRHADGYLARWLLATGVLFALSGLTYAARLARNRSSSSTPTTGTNASS